jgi:hypothetical protein
MNKNGKTIVIWLLIPALVLPAGAVWAEPGRGVSAETLSAPLRITAASFQTAYKQCAAEIPREQTVNPTAREILNAAVRVISGKGIAVFQFNTFYNDLGVELGFSAAALEDKGLRKKLLAAVARRMDVNGTKGERSNNVPFLRFLNCLEKAVRIGYIRVEKTRWQAVRECIARVRAGHYPLNERQARFLAVYAQCKGNYPAIAETLGISEGMVSTVFVRCSEKLGFDNLSAGTHRSEILKTALRRGDLAGVAAADREVISAYIGELEQSERQILSPNLRAMLEAALNAVIKNGYKTTSEDILAEMKNIDPENNQDMTVRRIRNYVMRARKKLGIPAGKYDSAPFLTLLECLGKAVEDNGIRFGREQAVRLRQLLADTRNKQYPFTRREQQVFIFLALDHGEYAKVSRRLNGLSHSRIGNLYAAGTQKLGFGDAREVTMSAAIRTALDNDKLGPVSGETRRQIIDGIAALAREETNPLTPAAREVLEAALIVGLNNQSPEIKREDIIRQLEKSTGKKKTYKAVNSLISEASRWLGLLNAEGANFTVITQCVSRAAERGFIACTAQQAADFRAHCRAMKLNPLQKKIVLLQALGLNTEQTYRTLSAEPGLAVKRKISIVYNYDIRNKFKVKAGERAIAEVTQKALEEEEINDAELLQAAQSAGLAVADVPEAGLGDCGKIREAVDKVCAGLACTAAELFQSSKFNYAKRFAYHGPGGTRVIGAAELLQIYKEGEFQSRFSVRYWLRQVQERAGQAGEAAPAEEDYVAVFMKFYYDRPNLEAEIKDDLMRVYLSTRQVLSETTLKINSAIVRKWGVKIYEDVFGVDFQSVIKMIMRNPAEAADYKRRYEEPRPEADNKNREGARAAKLSGNVVSGPAPGAVVILPKKTDRMIMPYSEAGRTEFRFLLNGYIRGGIDDADLEQSLRRLYRLCPQVSGMNVQMVERRMEDILWAQKALQGHDPTALKSKQQAGKLTMGTYFCFRLMIQQIVNGRLYQTMEKHKAELVRAIADRYAERMMIGIDEDGLDADDLGRFDFDDDEISMLSEKTGDNHAMAETIEQSI